MSAANNNVQQYARAVANLQGVNENLLSPLSFQFSRPLLLFFLLSLPLFSSSSSFISFLYLLYLIFVYFISSFFVFLLYRYLLNFYSSSCSFFSSSPKFSSHHSYLLVLPLLSFLYPFLCSLLCFSFSSFSYNFFFFFLLYRFLLLLSPPPPPPFLLLPTSHQLIQSLLFVLYLFGSSHISPFLFPNRFWSNSNVSLTVAWRRSHVVSNRSWRRVRGVKAPPRKKRNGRKLRSPSWRQPWQRRPGSMSKSPRRIESSPIRKRRWRSAINS